MIKIVSINVVVIIYRYDNLNETFIKTNLKKSDLQTNTIYHSYRVVTLPTLSLNVSEIITSNLKLIGQF